MPRRVARLQAAPDSALAWPPSQRLIWEGAPIARLRASTSVLRPRVEVLDSEFLAAPEREAVRLRLQLFVEAEIADALAPLAAAVAGAESDSALRGRLHLLVEGLGVVPGPPDDELAPALRGRLKALGVRTGPFGMFLPALLKPRPASVRTRLWALRRGVACPALAAPGKVSMALPADWPAGFAEAIGWRAAGPVLLRLDIADRVAAELAWASRGRPLPVPLDLAGRLSVKADLLPAVLRALGVRLFPAGSLPPEMLGPPAPAMMATVRPKRIAAADPPVVGRREGPFAALSALRL